MKMNLKKVFSTGVEHHMDAELWVKSGHCELKEEPNKRLKLNLASLFGSSSGTASGESSAAFFPKKHECQTERYKSPKPIRSVINQGEIYI
jgi:hypothetical protein